MRERDRELVGEREIVDERGYKARQEHNQHQCMFCQRGKKKRHLVLKLLVYEALSYCV